MSRPPSGGRKGVTVSNVLTSLLNAQLDVGLGKPILWREVIGNLFGLASALGGARRRVWAWPVGIVGNVILFTVFLGGVFHTPQDLNLWGQAGRQIFFLATSAMAGWCGLPPDATMAPLRWPSIPGGPLVGNASSA